MAADNKTLGRFILDGIPPSPRGVPQVEVSFDIDANGILKVSAKDKATGKEQSIKIEGSSGLSAEEVEKMKKDAELHAEEDKKKKEQVEIRNTADALVFTTEKAMKEAGDKVTAEEKKPVEEKITALKEILKDEKADAEKIKKASQELSEAAQKIGEKLYKAADDAAKATSDQAGGTGKKDEPKDAEVTDDSKKEGTNDASVEPKKDDKGGKPTETDKK